MLTLFRVSMNRWKGALPKFSNAPFYIGLKLLSAKFILGCQYTLDPLLLFDRLPLQ